MWFTRLVIAFLIWGLSSGGFVDEPCSERNTLYVVDFNITKPPSTIQCVDLSSLNKNFIRRKFFLKRIKSIRHIKSLYADRVGFVNPPLVHFLSDLKEIDFSYNRIRKIPSSFFAKNRDLELLILSYNFISMPKMEPFIISESLQTLVLSGNQIKQLYRNTFSSLPNLKSLELDNNDITKISYNVFRHNQNLQYVQLKKNPVSALSIYKPQTLKTILYDKK